MEDNAPSYVEKLEAQIALHERSNASLIYSLHKHKRLSQKRMARLKALQVKYRELVEVCERLTRESQGG